MLALATLVLARTFLEPVRIAQIKDERLPESSGLASSLAVPGTFLTVNDSGNPASLFRIDKRGQIVAEYRLDGAVNFDWEDMAVWRQGTSNWVFIGDIGDNAHIRASISVYRLKEPKLGGISDFKTFERFEFKYPDGAHNAETLMVDPKSGDLWIVTKVETGECQVFRAASGYKKGLEAIGTLKIDTGGDGGRLTTGGAFSLDGKRVVVRTYSGGLEFDVPKNRSQWFKSKPRPVPMPKSRGGEAVCYGLDSKNLFTTTEGLPCPLFRIGIQ